MSSTDRVVAGGEGRAGYDALRSGAAVHRLARDVVAATGPDAAAYLQGQCSQDVEAIAPGGSAETLLLSPQGKVEVYARVTRRGEDAFVLDTDAGWGAAMVARLERFRLRVAVELEPLAWACVAVRGPESESVLTGGEELRLPVGWPGLAGVDLLGPDTGDMAASWVEGGAVPCGEEDFEAARIEAGIPRAGRELTEGTIAAEVGLVDRTVSFTKGCFTGQELVARLDARGSNVARRLCGVVPRDGAAVPPVGAEVWTIDGAHQVGLLTSAAWSPGSETVVALAVLHRRIAPPAPVVLRWNDAERAMETTAEARLLPLRT